MTTNKEINGYQWNDRIIKQIEHDNEWINEVGVRTYLNGK